MNSQITAGLLAVGLLAACSSDPQRTPGGGTGSGGATSASGGSQSATGGAAPGQSGGADSGLGGSPSAASGGQGSGGQGTGGTGGGEASGGTGGVAEGAGGQVSSGDAGAALDGERWETPVSAEPPQGLDHCVYTDKTVSFGGTVGTTYTVTLRFRGVLEGKEYTGGTAEGSGLQFYRGGTPVTEGSWGPYNTVGFTVSAPQGTFYLNNAEGNDVIMDDAVYALDYTATITVAGGATVRLFSEDSNCEAVPNSVPLSVEGVPGLGNRQFAQVNLVSVVAN